MLSAKVTWRPSGTLLPMVSQGLSLDARKVHLAPTEKVVTLGRGKQ